MTFEINLNKVFKGFRKIKKKVLAYVDQKIEVLVVKQF